MRNNGDGMLAQPEYLLPDNAKTIVAFFYENGNATEVLSPLSYSEMHNSILRDWENENVCAQYRSLKAENAQLDSAGKTVKATFVYVNFKKLVTITLTEINNSRIITRNVDIIRP